MAVDDYDRLWYDYGQRVGRDNGYHGHNEPAPTKTSVEGVFKTLRTIRFQHPNEAIRLLAERLDARLDSFYNEVHLGRGKLNQTTNRKSSGANKPEDYFTRSATVQPRLHRPPTQIASAEPD